MSIIGIDLGTTNSLVSVWKDGESVLIPNAMGHYLTPSIVSVDESDGTVYVGEVAALRKVSHPTYTASVFKRSMGSRKEFTLGNQTFSPEELSAFVLRRLKEDAEQFLGEPVSEAIISVPAYFNDMARSATKRAGTLAGLQVERIVNEPSAAALACQHNRQQEDAMILVFDLGGGTLDVSLVECFDNVLNILSVSGDNYLGGHDFDLVLAKGFCADKGLVWEQLKKETQSVILASAERCKRELTENDTAVMVVNCTEINDEFKVDQNYLADASAELFGKIEKPIRSVLIDAGIDAAELTDVVMVGGSCKMPLIRQYLHYLLMRSDIETMDPDHIIAKGIGICAGIKERNADIKDMLLTDICPFSLGVETHNDASPQDGIMHAIIERNASLPTSREQSYHTIKDQQTKMTLNVYQGENYYVKDNLKLSDLTVKIPPAPKGKISVKVRFTYDVNGILEVNTYVPATGATERLVIVNKELQYSQEELDMKLHSFEKMKTNPRDQEANKLLVSQGQQLYSRLTEPLRSEIGERLNYFQHLLNNQDEYKIRKMYKFIQAYFDMVQEHIDAMVPTSSLNSFTQNWYQRNPDQSIIENFEEWCKKNKK